MSLPMIPNPITDDPIGAKAIEVAALLGDSVVDVKHCIDPGSGKVSRTTLGCLGAAAVFLALSAIAFAVSVHVAAANQAGLEHWTHALHRPAFAYRPEVLGFGFDWMMFGGLLFGIVAAGAGLSRLRAERRTPYYRIGTAPGVELALEGAPTPDFPLVAPSPTGDDFVFNYAAGIDGDLSLDGTTTPLAVLAANGRARPSAIVAGAIELPIPARAKIHARTGTTRFVITAVPEPRRHVVPLFAALERRTVTYFAGSLGVHLGLILLLAQIPMDDSAANIDLASTESLSTRSTTTIKDSPSPIDKSDDSGDDGNPGADAKKMELDPGTSGKPDAATEHGRIAVQDNHVDPQLARQHAIDEAREAGILGPNSALHASAFDALVATGNIDSGFDQQSVYGALDGTMVGEARGTFGFGLSGTGRGGGCLGGDCGLIGTGTSYHTIGVGSHAGYGWNGGMGDGPGGRRHVAGVPHVSTGQPDSVGTLDKAVIRRYIMRSLPKITYCYEHELLARPDLAGEIVVQFFISPTGTVEGSQGAGFDATVGRCVADVIGNIGFPAAPGGVTVRYPFTFRGAH